METTEKKQALFSSGIIWHFIGPLQSNKVKVIANCATWIHTLDREKIILKLNAACKEINKKIALPDECYLNYRKFQSLEITYMLDYYMLKVKSVSMAYLVSD